MTTTTTLATAHISSTAPASAFFERWADMATWPDWNLDTAWVRLDGDFAEGATGMLKPKGGPKVRFIVARLVPGSVFDDVSLLVGARLSFLHRVTPTASGGSDVAVTVTMAGPLAWLWRRLLGKGLAASLQPDLERLAVAAEAAHTPVGRTGSTTPAPLPTS